MLSMNPFTTSSLRAVGFLRAARVEAQRKKPKAPRLLVRPQAIRILV